MRRLSRWLDRRWARITRRYTATHHQPHGRTTGMNKPNYDQETPVRFSGSSKVEATFHDPGGASNVPVSSVARRDPACWPTPEQFVAEWEALSPEVRLRTAGNLIESMQREERLDRAIDRARMERAQAEDAETEAVARAVSADSELVSLRAEVERLTGVVSRADAEIEQSHVQILETMDQAHEAMAERDRLREGLEALADRAQGNVATPGNYEGEPIRNYVMVAALRALLASSPAATTGEAVTCEWCKDQGFVLMPCVDCGRSRPRVGPAPVSSGEAGTGEAVCPWCGDAEGEAGS